MRKMIIFLMSLLTLVGCQNIFGTKSILDDVYVKLSCSDSSVSGSLRISSFDCEDGPVYFNYHEELLFSVVEDHKRTEYFLDYDNGYYEILKDGETSAYGNNNYIFDYYNHYHDVYEDIEIIAKFFEILDVYDQSIGEVIYDPDSEEFARIRNYYYGTVLDKDRDDWPILEIIIINKTSKTTIEVTIEEDIYYSDDDGFQSTTFSVDWGYSKRTF